MKMGLSLPCSKTAGKESFIDLHFDPVRLPRESHDQPFPCWIFKIFSIIFQISKNIFFTFEYCVSTIDTDL